MKILLAPVPWFPLTRAKPHPSTYPSLKFPEIYVRQCSLSRERSLCPSEVFCIPSSGRLDTAFNLGRSASLG